MSVVGSLDRLLQKKATNPVSFQKIYSRRKVSQTKEQINLLSTPLRSRLGVLRTYSCGQLQSLDVSMYMEVQKVEDGPWRPAAWTIEAISADDSRSGRDTSIKI